MTSIKYHGENLYMFLDKNPYFNVFMISDIYYDSKEIKVYFEKKRGEVNSVLLKSGRHFNLNFHSSADIKELCKTVDYEISDTSNAILACEKTQMESLLNHTKLKPKKITNNDFCICKQISLKNNVNLSEVEESTVEDSVEISKLLSSLPEFENASNEMIKNEISTGKRFTCHIFLEDRIVSTASYVAETENAAMIIAVGTLKGDNFRKKGYATACVLYLVKHLHDKGKVPCIFYSNPVAGKVYEKIGFEKIGEWTIAYF